MLDTAGTWAALNAADNQTHLDHVHAGPTHRLHVYRNKIGASLWDWWITRNDSGRTVAYGVGTDQDDALTSGWKVLTSVATGGGR
jgi:hypothetical protein